MPNKLTLGIDAGGTKTRWALANALCEIIAEGQVSAITALQMNNTVGQTRLRESLGELATAVLAIGPPVRIHAGLTGFDYENAEQLRSIIAQPFGLAIDAVSVSNDIEITYLSIFTPGEGYVVYAGTGSVAAFIDAHGELHRAGGRGGLLDDGGGGYWIAREALRKIWRTEDEHPGSWQRSPLAQAIFQRIGGSDWLHSRQFIYGMGHEKARGEMAKLALTVAACADNDPSARAILCAAGEELARLALAMLGRFGTRPIALTGGTTTLHPLIEHAMRTALPENTTLTLQSSNGHQTAALLAAKVAFKK